MQNIIRRALTRREQGEAGFTLIELLVVVLILGVLSGITIVAVSDARANSIVTACNTDKVELVKAIDAYRADPANNGYPANLGALVPNYLRQLPTSTEYTFSYNNNPTPTNPKIITPAPATGKTIVTTTNCPAI